MILSSPRPWGCFSSPSAVRSTARVFPTPVGVFPDIPDVLLCPLSLPHARGGVSVISSRFCSLLLSSPRPWGCFPINHFLICVIYVFPTPVGVFPDEAHEIATRHGLPHARGGVSPASLKHITSPAVFPTPVGVFLSYSPVCAASSCLPHARGGVSEAVRQQ